MSHIQTKMKAPEVNGVEAQYDAADSNDEESDHLLKNSSSLSNTVVEEIPCDRCVTYTICFVLGMCSVLPWNMFITAVTYFDYKFHNVSGNGTGRTSLETSFESYFSVAAMVPNLIFQMINLAVQHRISLQIRVMVPLIGMLILFVLTTTLAKVDTDEWQIWFFAVCMCSVILINVCGAVYQGSVFGLAGILPRRYMQAIMSGQGMGGILPSLLSIVSIAATSDPEESGFIYFLCSVVCILITITAFLVLPKIKYAAHYLNKHAEMTKVKKSRELESTESFEKVKHHQKPPFAEIFWKIKVPAVMVLVVFAVTLGLFPGTLSSVKAVNTNNKKWAHEYFSPVACFLVFNTMDFTGRSLAVIEWPKPNHMPVISILVLLRFAFFPLFAFCNLQNDNAPSRVFFSNDAYFIVFNVLFGLTNGYLGSLLMIYGPKFVDVKWSETAGVMMSLFLGTGLAIGSVISVLFLKIV
ncbi:equilibrative nucleoside transporter 1-like isoform X2 [Acanthaster planci]|uniref:Equilibrative nucleoside transporter 1-like isoform X2 n=1 Tax=Acanthaster planci TaxID=133434 RepID=A0A8B7YNH9_ACAPL|nr:equilibrative nucleoside transporter 1-like isoform X2 [Acanthaster planci]